MQSKTRYFFELLWSMTKKEFHVRYKHTFFGFLWLIINPLIQMSVIGFVFTFFMKTPLEHYYYFLFIGLLAWNFFSLSLSKATPSIVFERSLIKKAAFPRSIIPLAIISSNWIHYMTALVLLLIPISVIKTFSFEKIPYILAALILLLIFTIGLSLLTSALNVKYRDVNFFVSALLIPWFYATPIIYSLSQMPPHLLWIWRLNPLTTILQLLQYAFLGAPAPGIGMLLSNITVICVVSALGVAVFHINSKTFDDWV